MSGADEPARQRAALKRRIDGIEADVTAADGSRDRFFDAVYEAAGEDPAAVPWADLRAKPELVDWLARNPGGNRRAIDVACGLGDNAEAIAAAGYDTVGFDGSRKAVGWARQRFPASPVDYRIADLLDLPGEWRGAFDLVNECYTVQAVPPDMHPAFSRAIASLVAPGGVLLVYMRRRDEGGPVSGPPWPLSPRELAIFGDFGLKRIEHRPFVLGRADRDIPVVFDVWRRF